MHKTLSREELDATDDEAHSPVLTSSDDMNCPEEDGDPIAENREPNVGDYVLVTFSGKGASVLCEKNNKTERWGWLF
jgi:hypothetical protein